VSADAINRELSAVRADPGALEAWIESLSTTQHQALLDLLDLWRKHP